MSKILNTFFEKSFGNQEKELTNIKLETEKGRQNLSTVFLNLIDKNLRDVEKAEKYVKDINETFDSKLTELQYKLDKVVEKVRGAILTERGTSGAIYTTQIPINKQQIANKTTTKIEDGIAFGVPNTEESYAGDLNLLSLRDLEFSDLLYNSLNKEKDDALINFSIESQTQINSPIEFTVNLSGIIRTDSSLIFDLKSHGIVEVYKNKQLYKEKSLLKTIILPVDITTSTVTLRVYPSINRHNGIHFNRIGYTELIYDQATYFETKNIIINKDFSQLVIDTCDNSNDSNININYYVSINNNEWESFSPVMKHKAIEKQSIITLDKSKILKMYEVEGNKVTDGDIRFYIPSNLQTNLVYKHRAFILNKKDVITELKLAVQNDIQLITNAVLTNSSNLLYVNGRQVENEDFTLFKGINKLVALSPNGDIQRLNLEYLEGLIGAENIFQKEVEKEIFIDDKGEKYISLTLPELNETVASNLTVYMPGIKEKVTVNTLKIKAELQSTDKKTVPFISRLLVRGI